VLCALPGVNSELQWKYSFSVLNRFLFLRVKTFPLGFLMFKLHAEDKTNMDVRPLKRIYWRFCVTCNQEIKAETTQIKLVTQA
jgi:hypothetical protein